MVSGYKDMNLFFVDNEIIITNNNIRNDNK